MGLLPGKEYSPAYGRDICRLRVGDGLSDAKRSAQLREKYQAEANTFRDQQKDIDAAARKLEQETNHERARADRYDLAEVFLEIGLVVTSITLLSGRRIFWQSGIVLGVIGLIVAGTAPLVK